MSKAFTDPSKKLRRKQASFLAVLLIIVCWCTFVFPFASQSRQSKKHSVDLSAGKAGQAWKIPQSVWTNLNSFVFLIGFDVYRPGEINVEYAKRFGQLKAYSELRAATQQWGNETFPLLNKLATELSKGEIRELLSAMSVALDRRKSDVRAQKVFEEKFTALNQRFNELGQLSATVTQQFDRLDKVSRSAIHEYQSRNFPENEWVKLGPKLDDVQTALGLMNNQWTALKSDLNDLRKLMANQKLDDVDIEVGLLTWDDITQAAKAFVTNIPAQQKYLTGENYYDDCPIDVNSYYLIVSKEREQDWNFGALIINDSSLSVIPLKGSSASDMRKEWRFTRFEKGWWGITNRALSYSGYALGTTNLSSSPGYHRFWRVLPTQEKEWFRLINASTGELKSLTASGRSATLSPTKNHTTQYWRFIKTDKVR